MPAQHSRAQRKKFNCIAMKADHVIAIVAHIHRYTHISIHTHVCAVYVCVWQGDSFCCRRRRPTTHGNSVAILRQFLLKFRIFNLFSTESSRAASRLYTHSCHPALAFWFVAAAWNWSAKMATDTVRDLNLASQRLAYPAPSLLTSPSCHPACLPWSALYLLFKGKVKASLNGNPIAMGAKPE